VLDNQGVFFGAISARTKQEVDAPAVVSNSGNGQNYNVPPKNYSVPVSNPANPQRPEQSLQQYPGGYK